MRALFLGLTASAMTFLTGQALAAPEIYAFEKPHTQIGFYVSHLGFSKSHGRFLDFDGKLMLDRDAPENSSVTFTIDVASLEMNDEKWNAHLMEEKYFNAENYPEMRFESTAIRLLDDNSAEVTGELTLLGEVRPVTLTLTHNKSAPNPFSGKYTAGFSGTASLIRSDFGMTGGLPMVGDEVEIRIEAETFCVENCPENLNN